MDMKFRAHDTFFIRKGWLCKGMRNVVSNPDVFVDKNTNPMDVLGIGANMVKALRYWLQAVDLTSEPKAGKRSQTLTGFGKIVYERDSYIEENGTLCLLHYKLSTNVSEATSWNFFFNSFNYSEFSKDDFIESLQSFVKESGEEVAARSLNDDFSCIVNTYLPRYKLNPERVSPENNIDCPLGELGLIDIANKKKKTFKKVPIKADFLDPYIALAIIVDQNKGRQEIGLNELLNAENSIGRIFNLDSIALLDVLYKVEKIGLIKINRTAGLDMINLLSDMDFDDCIKAYYDSIEK